MFSFVVTSYAVDNPYDFNNTVPRTAITVHVAYYDSAGKIREVSQRCSSSGNFLIKRPSDFSRIYRVYFALGRSGLPTSGKYRYNVSFVQHTSGFFNPSYYQVGFGKKYPNAEWVWEYQRVGGQSNVGNGVWMMTGTVDVGYIDYFEF